MKKLSTFLCILLVTLSSIAQTDTETLELAAAKMIANAHLEAIKKVAEQPFPVIMTVGEAKKIEGKTVVYNNSHFRGIFASDGPSSFEIGVEKLRREKRTLVIKNIILSLMAVSTWFVFIIFLINKVAKKYNKNININKTR